MNLLLFSIYTKKLIVTVNVYNEKQLLNDGNILLTAHKKMGKLYWTLYLWNPIFLFLNFTQFWKILSSHRLVCTQESYVVLSLYGILPITYLKNSLIPADINIPGMLLLSLIIWKTWLTWCVSVFIAAQHQQGNNAQVILGREYDAWPLLFPVCHFPVLRGNMYLRVQRGSVVSQSVSDSTSMLCCAVLVLASIPQEHAFNNSHSKEPFL